MKKILITGANSYIGTSFEKYMEQFDDYQINTLDMQDSNWKKYDFSQYDSVFHVAGIAHADVGHVSEEIKQLYYKVNRDLTIEACLKAKDEGVKQFIFMSSMIVYSGCKETFITKEIKPKAENFYGDSKLQADLAIQEFAADLFKVCVIRPPMIYGKGSKGNYPMLAKLATKLPFFPKVKNQRSMLYIDNLCEFIRLMIENEESGVFFPQNSEYTNTSELVKMISVVKGHRILIIPGTDMLVKRLTKLPGKMGMLSSKAFCNLTYDMTMSKYSKGNYCVKNLNESIKLTEEIDNEKNIIFS